MAKNSLNQSVRADVDDRNLTVGKKIALAEKEWVHYIIVIGKKEQDGENLTVRSRSSGKQIKMPYEKLIRQIKKTTAGMPYEPLALPNKLSERPIFVG